MATKKKIIQKPDEADLRRWCIETALRFPAENYQASGGYQQMGALGGSVLKESEVLHRAARILNWIKG